MHPTKKTFILVLVIVSITIILFAWMMLTAHKISPAPTPNTEQSTISIETYLREHISELSPIKEQLGGTFYITKIEAYENGGVVYYEDGHNAYSADFMYRDTDHTITVTSFIVRQ